MMSKQKIVVIIIAVSFLISIFWNVSRLIPETKNYESYSVALKEYDNHEYKEAFHSFGKVSRFSKLRSAAIFRQALCANKAGDVKTEIKKYKETIRNFPNSELSLRAKYLLAQQYFESKKYGKSGNEFKKIFEKYPNTDYGTAAQYYLGAIEAEKSIHSNNLAKKSKCNNRATKYFKAYIKKAPDGKFALNCVDKWLSLKTKLNNEDYLLIVQAYQASKDYNNAQKYLKFTNISVSWPYFVKNAYAAKNFARVKYYTEEGLKGSGSNQILINENIDEKTENENIYKAIDTYLKVSGSPKTSLSYLFSISKSAKGHDYLMYKTCKNLPDYGQTACYNTLYKLNPDGNFAAEALSAIFYSKVKSQNYEDAKRIGRIHLSKFRDSKSAPKVMFWLAKISERTKNYDRARGYYKSLIKQFPDDYYAYHSFLNLHRYASFHYVDLKKLPVEFPYKNSNYELISELLKVNDYGLINQLYKEDDFIHSWLSYQQGDFDASARIARDAMDKLDQKPPRSDLRWRLVYPLNYYDDVKRYANFKNNDPTLILSIIREESYFNKSARSPVGARGLMQLMPSTAMEAANRSGVFLPNPQLLYDPDMNIKLGNIYYSTLKNLLGEKDILAVLAYNGGIGSVSRWKANLTYVDVDDFVEQIPYSETQNYLKKVYRSYWNYLRIYDGVKF